MKMKLIVVLFAIFIIIAGIACIGWLSSPNGANEIAPLGNPYTDEKRKDIDIRLFNELLVRANAWPGIGKTREKRYAWIKSQADNGYELAEITLKLFDLKPGEWKRSFDRATFKRLNILAERGDASAQCLYIMASVKWKRESKKNIDKYIAASAKQNHPTCLMYQASHEKELGHRELSLSLSERAARLGNNLMQVVLIRNYSQGLAGYPEDIGKALCWYEIAIRPEFNTGKATATRPDLAWLIRKLIDRNINHYFVYEQSSWCQNTQGTAQLSEYELVSSTRSGNQQLIGK